jgi:transketolase
MRHEFAVALEKEMAKDERIVVLTGDLGYKMWDEIRDKYPQRFINCGASEQAMMDIAVGLAYDGKIPFCYSIATFLVYRCFETIRTYIDFENLPVKLVASGRNNDYEIDGISHDATDVGLFLSPLANIIQYWPKSKGIIPKMLKQMLADEGPSFISLKR